MASSIRSRPAFVAGVLTLIAWSVWQPTTSSADPVVNASSVADASSPSNRSDAKRSAPVGQTEEHALKLVQAHLPELSKLLQRLKSDNQRQYEIAIRDLAKSAKRLEFAKSRSDELYEIEVELLKSQSSVKIMAAKLKVRDSELGREQLRQAVQRQWNAEIAKADYTVQSLKDRAEKAQQQLSAAKTRMETLKQDSTVQLEKKYIVLLRNAGRLKPEARKKLTKSKPSNTTKSGTSKSASTPQSFQD